MYTYQVSLIVVFVVLSQYFGQSDGCEHHLLGSLVVAETAPIASKYSIIVVDININVFFFIII